ncbi:MAG: GNAT family N-acetyltransferase, partial [Pseudomonadota bacterium]
GETHVLGLASAQIMFKPHSSKMALYVDEVDVCTDHRRRGVGRLLMERLRSIAKARRCREIWLATEHNNGAALGLYQSLGPDEVIDARVFTFETVDS